MVESRRLSGLVRDSPAWRYRSTSTWRRERTGSIGLATRLGVESSDAAQDAAIAAADDATLPILRDALLAVLDPGMPGFRRGRPHLRLFVDVGAGAQDVTTRVEQAIETVQSVMLAARTNRLAPQDPWPPAGPAAGWRLRETHDYSRADFDEEWRWMGAYASWRAAVSVFFRPELMLFPTLRSARKAGIHGDAGIIELLGELAAAWQRPHAALARNEAAAYKATLVGDEKAALQPIWELILTDQLPPARLAELAAGQSRPAGDPQGRPTGVLADETFRTLRDVPPVLLEVLWLVPLAPRDRAQPRRRAHRGDRLAAHPLRVRADERRADRLRRLSHPEAVRARGSPAH